MKRKRHTPEQIINKLREADRLLGQDKGIGAVVKALGVSEQTYYRWKKKYASVGSDEIKRLRALEKENARLKRLVAEQALDLLMAKEVIAGKY